MIMITTIWINNFFKYFAQPTLHHRKEKQKYWNVLEINKNLYIKINDSKYKYNNNTECVELLVKKT